MWDLNQILKESEIDKTLKEIERKSKLFEKNRSILSKDISSKDFVKMLEDSEEISRLKSLIQVRTYLKFSENTADTKISAFMSRISKLFTELGNKKMFFNLWIRDLDDKNFTKLLKDSGKFKYHLERIRVLKPHTLSEREEQLISLKNIVGISTVEKIYDVFTNSFVYDLKDKKDLTQDELLKYVKDPDPKVRRETYDALLGKYEKNENVIGEIYSAVQTDMEISGKKIRNFKTPYEATLLSHDVSEKVFNMILDLTKKNKGIFKEYFDLKFKYLGIKGNRYDLYAPVNSKSKEYSFEESKKIVLDSFKEFSEEFYQAANKTFEDKTIHSDVQKRQNEWRVLLFL